MVKSTKVSMVTEQSESCRKLLEDYGKTKSAALLNEMNADKISIEDYKIIIEFQKGELDIESFLETKFPQSISRKDTVSLKDTLSSENTVSLKKTVSQKDTVSEKDILKKTSILSNYIKTDIDVMDKALPTMDITAQIIYMRLYRLSWGFGRNYCKVGYTALRKSCNIKTTNAIKRGLDRLISEGWIEKLDTSSPSGDSYTYRVYLPCEKGIDSNTEIKNDTISLKYTVSSKDTVSINNTVSPNGILPVSPKDTVIDNIINRSNTLSPSNIVDLFYKGIGQENIAKRKREKAEKNIKELTEEGFSQEDIVFAINWTIKNAKEKPYDFSLIKDTIGQAMAEKDKIQKEQKLQIENEMSKTQKEEQEKEEEKIRENIIAIKQNLSTTERSELRNKALEIIKNTDGIKEYLITEILIEAKENEMLKLRLKKQK